MNDPRLLEMQARQLEGHSISGPEVLELQEARKEPGHMARLLKEDQQLHADLLELYRMEATAAEFARRCMAKSDVDSGETVKTPVPCLEVASPLDRLRSYQPKRTSQTVRMAGWITVVATVGLVFITAWWWIPRTTNGPVSVAGTTDQKNGVQRDAQPAFDDRPESQLAENAANQPAKEDADTESGSGILLEHGLAGMRFSEDSDWEQMPVDEHSFPADYKLRSGVAELVLDDGTEMVFQGPAIMTLESPRKIRVDEGRFRIQPVAGEKEFSITTPTVWLNGRDDFLAFLNVFPIDGTLVHLERGELKARPWANDRAEELSLAAGAMDRGVFGPAWRDDSLQPATAVALNENGDFISLVDAADRPLRVSSPAVFAQVLDTSRTMIREDPKQFPQQWQGMVQNLENSVSNTDLNINGQSVHPTSPEDMMDQFNRIREQMIKGVDPGAAGNSESAFSGMLNVNGQEQRFTSPEEFLDAQQKMFGPMFGRMMGQMPNGTAGIGVLGSGSPATTGSGISQLPEKSNRPAHSSGNSNSMSVFSGMINNNGQEMQFTSPEDFNRAMQQLRLRR